MPSLNQTSSPPTQITNFCSVKTLEKISCYFVYDFKYSKATRIAHISSLSSISQWSGARCWSAAAPALARFALELHRAVLCDELSGRAQEGWQTAPRKNSGTIRLSPNLWDECTAIIGLPLLEIAAAQINQCLKPKNGFNFIESATNSPVRSIFWFKS